MPGGPTGEPVHPLGLVIVILCVIAAMTLSPLSPALSALVVGVGVSPRLVGCMRALLYHLLPGAIALAVASYYQWDNPKLAALIPIAMAILRVTEGFLDGWQKPEQNVVAPPPEDPEAPHPDQALVLAILVFLAVLLVLVLLRLTGLA